MVSKNIIISEVVEVPLTKLKVFPGNPRKGNVQAIADSLKVNKQYRPLVVQKSTGQVLAGNHTFMAAESLGWKQVAVTYVDVDDTQAKRIVLADNKTTDLATMDNEALAKILASLPDISGTAYQQSEVDGLLSSIANHQTELGTVIEPGPLDENLAHVTFAHDQAWDGDSNEHQVYDGVSPEGGSDEDDFEYVREDLKGIMDLKQEVLFDGTTFYGIPKIRADMLVETIPDKLLTWAGNTTKDWYNENPDPDIYWFYNFGNDSTSGMHDLSHMFLAFFSLDEYFENWWYYTPRYIAKALNTKLKYAVGPDFSQKMSEPRAVCIYQYYRTAWISRYLQEVGIRVMPNTNWRWGDIEILRQIVIPSIPVGLPWICKGSISFAATGIGDEYGEDSDEYRRLIQAEIACYQEVIDTLQPKNWLMYAGAYSKSVIESWPIDWKDTNIVWQQDRMSKISDAAKKYTKKHTF